VSYDVVVKQSKTRGRSPRSRWVELRGVEILTSLRSTRSHGVSPRCHNQSRKPAYSIADRRVSHATLRWPGKRAASQSRSDRAASFGRSGRVHFQAISRATTDRTDRSVQIHVVAGGDDQIVSTSLPQCLHQAACARTRENEVSYGLRHRWSSMEETLMTSLKSGVHSSSTEISAVGGLKCQKERGPNLRWSPSTAWALPGMCPNRSSGRDLVRSRPRERTYML
jgi:hypothetical protein